MVSWWRLGSNFRAQSPNQQISQRDPHVAASYSFCCPPKINTLAARGLEEHLQVSQIFAIIVSFMLFTVFTLANVLYFEEFMIHDSHGFMILKNN